MRREMGAVRFALLCLLAVAPHALTGQRDALAQQAMGVRQARTPVADTQQILSRARRAQRAFERTRLRHLPRSERSDGRCHEIVGRYCVWHDPDDPWTAPPDPPELVEARAELLAELAELASQAPGERWIHGQRVRYLVEAGQLKEAVGLASSCEMADSTWCHALLGFALHATGDDLGSETAFATALAGLAEEERCRWQDLELLLEGDSRAYERLACAERGDWEAAFWQLADPLFLVPGNSRRAEHLSRHVMDALQQGAASGYDARWGRDLRELLVRYGWPAGWSREWRRPFGLRRELVITAHDPPEARRFVPKPEWVGHPDSTLRKEWRLNPQRPRTLYAPGKTVFVDSLEHQVARFPRGDTVIVVSAWDVSRDTIPACKSLEHGLFLTDRWGRMMAEARARTTAERGVLSVSLSEPEPAEAAMAPQTDHFSEDTPFWLGLEVACPVADWAGRSRYGVGLAAAESDGLSLSDLLVLGDPGDGEPPATLAEALPLALGALQARSGKRVALYWELYDRAGTGGEVDVTVTLTRIDKGFFRRAVEWAGLARAGEEAVGLQWRERSNGVAMSSRAVTLDLPALPEGVYRLSLDVSTARGPLESSRVLRVGR